MTISTSGIFCVVKITNALPKDNGDWKLTIGTGEQLSDFKKNTFLYHISVKGNIETIYIKTFKLKPNAKFNTNLLHFM